MQPIFLAISDRLFSFPQTENLCATLFDVLLGGASPKQVMCHMEPLSLRSRVFPLLVQYSSFLREFSNNIDVFDKTE